MSRLANAPSPYLRAHADNPVDWYAWGEEPFEVARRRDVPVLVSIGYSTCHWCHVMARESFADDGIADLLNESFVSIKVDREEHPEVDDAYMAQASAFTRGLGWPLTVFVTPDGRAFYAGTYFPPEPRHGLPSFRQVLEAVHEAWTQRRPQIEDTAARLAEALSTAAHAPTPRDATRLDVRTFVDAAARLADREDSRFGGFAPADAPRETPKFPSVPALSFLQKTVLAEEFSGAADVAHRALMAMADSEMRDRVDGGFFRYATRRDWTVPHYERMLTDNAGLIEIALDAGEHRLAIGTADFLLDVMQRPQGGFAAAQDSESWIDGVRDEGGYYALDAAGRARLLPPEIDAKLVTGWNGLAIRALARLALRTGGERFLRGATDAAQAVLRDNIARDGTLVRASLDGVRSSSLAGTEDYGLFADGLLTLAAVSGDLELALRARQLIDAALDGVPGDAVLAAQGLQAPAAESDTDIASGSAALAAASVRLWMWGAGENYRSAAERLLAPGLAEALRNPIAHGALLGVAAALAEPPRQLVIIAPAANDQDAMIDAARAVPADITIIMSESAARVLADRGFELFEGRIAQHGSVTAYQCDAFVCALPITDPALLAR